MRNFTNQKIDFQKNLFLDSSLPQQLAGSVLCAALLTHQMISSVPSKLLIAGLLLGFFIIGVYRLLERNWTILLTIIVTGLLSSVWFNYHYARHTPIDHAYKNIAASGWVDRLPNNKQNKQSFTLFVDQSEQAALIGKRVLVTDYYHLPEMVRAGQHLSITTDWKPPSGLQNPHGFDYARYLRTQHIHATAYLNASSEVTIKTGKLCCRMSRWREHIRERLSAYRDHPQYSLLLGLTIGDRSEMTDAQKSTLQRTGTAHLLAISGLHIGLVAGMAWLVCFNLFRLFPSVTSHYPAPTLAFVCAIFPALFYAALAGFTTPTIRAMSMLIILAVAYTKLQLPRLMDILALAAIVAFIIDPLSILTAGFWLSFYATALIIGFITIQRLESRSLRNFAIIDVGWLQLSLIAGMSLLTVYYFQGLSILSPLANLIAIPWASLVTIPLILLSTLLQSIFPTLAHHLTLLALYSLDLLWQWLSLLSEGNWLSNWQYVTLPKPNLIAVWLSPILMITIAYRFRRWRWLLGSMMVVIIAFVHPQQCSKLLSGDNEDSLTLLSVKNGLSAVLNMTDDNHKPQTLLIGAGRHSFNTQPIAQHTLLPYLSAERRRPKLLLLPFLKQDVTGGTRLIRETFPDIRILTPKKDQTIDSQSCAGFNFPEGEIASGKLSAQLWDDHDLPSCLLHIRLSGTQANREILLVPGPLLHSPSFVKRIARQLQPLSQAQSPVALIIINSGRKDFDPSIIPESWRSQESLSIIVSGKISPEQPAADILSTNLHGAITLSPHHIHTLR